MLLRPELVLAKTTTPTWNKAVLRLLILVPAVLPRLLLVGRGGEGSMMGCSAAAGSGGDGASTLVRGRGAKWWPEPATASCFLLSAGRGGEGEEKSDCGRLVSPIPFKRDHRFSSALPVPPFLLVGRGSGGRTGGARGGLEFADGRRGFIWASGSLWSFRSLRRLLSGGLLSPPLSDAKRVSAPHSMLSVARVVLSSA